ncbi:MAG: ATP-dependent zinc metalloprotease FtsH [Synechococcaceae cyanobacterium]|nr:ATP-dependent zinc metalloprotease FtsH [Synechococcaceae cyanobacterium]
MAPGFLLAQGGPTPAGASGTGKPASGGAETTAASQSKPDAAAKVEGQPPKPLPTIRSALSSQPPTRADTAAVRGWSLGAQANDLSYSQLLEAIRGGKVAELELSPRQGYVDVVLKNGSRTQVAVFRDSNLLLLNTAQQANVPLTVRDERRDEAMASLFANVALVVLLVVALTLLVRRSAQVTNKAMGFGRSQPRMQPEGSVTVRFEDVAGIGEAKEELQEVVTFLKTPERFTTIGAKIPKGVLLVGPPGTGKTLLARAIAGEAGVPFFSMAASEFVELFVGVGASRVRDLFRKAKSKAPCIIFIDEIDAVGRQRGAGIGGGNDEREQTLNQLLTEMDGFEENSGVILLAATNRPDVLDSALMRPGRFDRRITVDLPDRKGREQILAVHARSRPLDASVSLSDWAARTPGFAGADLANLLNEAAILTARREQTTIDDNAIHDALERITMGLTAAPLQDSAKKRLIAYHEVGHALLTTLLPNADRLDKVTLLPRAGGIGGFARTMPDEDVLDSGIISRAYLRDRLVFILGGRAAEIVVFGPSEVTQGASSDLQQVSRICREMVTRYGFSKLGPLALDEVDGEVFLGADWLRPKKHYSDKTGDQIDHSVRRLAKRALRLAVETLEPRRELLDSLVERLIAEETIDGETFRSMVSAWEEAHPNLPSPIWTTEDEQSEEPSTAEPLSTTASASLNAASETNVEAAQVGV